MNMVNPNIEWYLSKSKSARVTPRCPIASAELCPRYYCSLSLLSDNEITTKITEKDRARLDKKWEPFKPTIIEEEPDIIRVDNKFAGVRNFCPEVSFDRFGYFASSIHRYADELDIDLAHKRLAEDGVNSTDPHWSWSTVTPLHYTECREYSILIETTSGKRKKSSRARKGFSAKLRWQVFSRDSFTCQYCGRRPPDVALEVDHRVSVAEGGGNDPENLLTACVECNRGKGAYSVR